MPDTTYYADGQWNVYCDLCGKKAKSGEVVKTWDGFYVCGKHKEERNPQDLLRGPRPTPPLPFTRPQPALVFVTTNSRILTEGTSGIGIGLEDGSGAILVEYAQSFPLPSP